MKPFRYTVTLMFFFLLISMRQGSAASSSSSAATMADCEQMAIKNHPSLRLTQEEVELAELKRKEAFRAIWPSLQIKGEQTDGAAERELGTPDFTEKSYGVQVNQSVFQGGRLYRVYRQAAASWESARARYTKAQQEVIYSVREASWNLVKASLISAMQERTLDDLEAEKKAANRLFEKDSITRQVYLTINAQYGQAVYSLEGARADVEARLWQWTAALGLKTPPDFRPTGAIPSEMKTFSLDECLRVANLRHPDLLIQRQAAEAARQGDLAGKSLYYPKLSINGFYGRSGGAFKGENLHMGEDWLAGVQISQYFGLNTANVSGFEQHTSPKIGQSTRTESKTATASVGILDGFKQKTEKKEAEFTNDQAQVQMERTEMEVANNVREAYANLKKAQAQLKIAENGVPLAKADYGIAKIRSAHRDVPYSERAVARNRLAQAEAALIEAQAGYQIARAALNRAVGVPDQF